MPLDLVPPPTDPGAGPWVRPAARGADLLALVTVVVLSNHVGVAARRLLAAVASTTAPPARAGAGPAPGRGLAARGRHVPHPVPAGRVARRQPARRRRAPPGVDTVVAAGLRQALAAEPGVFAPVAEHPATEAALVAAYGQLADLSEAALRSSGGVHRPRRRAAVSARPGPPVVGLVRRGRPGRRRRRRHDGRRPGDRQRGRGRHPPRAGAGTRHQARFCGRWPTAGRPRWWPPSRGPHRRRRRPAIARPPRLQGHRRRRGRRGGGGLAGVGRPHPAAHRVRRRRRSPGGRAGRRRRGPPGHPSKSPSSTAPRPYGRLLHEHFGGPGCRATARPSARWRPAPSAVSSPTCWPSRLTGSGGARSWACSAAPPSAPRRAPRTHPRVERMTREGGVVAGRADWDGRPGRPSPAGLDQRADDPQRPRSPPPPLPELPDCPRASTPARRRRRRPRPASRRRATTSAASRPTARAAPGRAAASRRPGGRRRHREASLGRTVPVAAAPGRGAPRRRRAPGGLALDEQRAFEKVDTILTRLSALDGRRPADARHLPPHARPRARRRPRPGAASARACWWPLSFAPGLDLDLVVVVGLAEGTLPGVVRDDSLLPDGERRRTGGELPLGAPGRAHPPAPAVRLRAPTAICSARCAATSGPAQRAVPSPGSLGVAGEMAGEHVTGEAFLGGDAVGRAVPSYAHAVTHVAFPATERTTGFGPARALDGALVGAGAEVFAPGRATSSPGSTATWAGSRCRRRSTPPPRPPRRGLGHVPPLLLRALPARRRGDRRPSCSWRSPRSTRRR